MANSPEEYGWSPEVQRKMVALPLLDPDAWGQLGPQVLDKAFVSYPPLKIVAEVLFQACEDGGGPPSPELLEQLVGERCALLKQTLADPVREELRRVLAADPSDVRLVRAKAVDWARTQALVRASNWTVDLIERGGAVNGDGDEILRKFQEALAVGQHSEEFLRVFGDPAGVIKILQRTVRRVRSGFAALDAATGGGVEVGLSMIAGSAKRGKTSFLTQVDVAAARRGLTVWHVSGEIHLWSMASRTLSSATGLSRSEVMGDPRRAVELTAGYRFARGEILVEYAPRFTPGWMATRLRQLEARGYQVGMITADYIDLMGSGRRETAERRWDLAAIAKDLRALAIDADVPLWTAKAVTASSVDKPVLSMQDLAECKEIAYIIDNLFALCSTKEDRAKAEKVIRLFYMLGRETEDERMLAAYRRDNDRQRWQELPGYLEAEAAKELARKTSGVV